MLFRSTAAQTTANLSQARTPVGISEGSTKGYFAGGLTSSTGRVITADKLTFSNDTTAAQTTANLSLGRDSLAGCSGEGSKGYFAGGISGTTLGGVYVTTTDKLTYSNDNTSAQTTADLSQPRQNLGGISEGSTKGYFVGGILAGSNNYSSVADKLTYSNDTT